MALLATVENDTSYLPTVDIWSTPRVEEHIDRAQCPYNYLVAARFRRLPHSLRMTWQTRPCQIFMSNTPMKPRCSMQPHVSLHRNEVDGLIPITYS